MTAAWLTLYVMLLPPDLGRVVRAPRRDETGDIAAAAELPDDEMSTSETMFLATLKVTAAASAPRSIAGSNPSRAAVAHVLGVTLAARRAAA